MQVRTCSGSSLTPLLMYLHVPTDRLQDDISGYHISGKTPAVDRGMSGMKGSSVEVRDITQEFAIASSGRRLPAGRWGN